MRRRAVVCWLLLAFGPAHADPRDPLDAVRLEDLSATRERPLFRPSRRPPLPVPAGVPTPASAPVVIAPAALEPPPFDLVGSVVGKHDAIVLLRNRAKGEVVRLHTGEEAEGWRAVSIGLRSVTLERDGREETLALTATPVAAATTLNAGEPQTVEPDDKPLSAELRRIAGHGRREP